MCIIMNNDCEFSNVLISIYFTEVPVPCQESERLCALAIDCASLYDFDTVKPV